MPADVHLPAVQYRCQSVAGTAKVGSLLTRVEQATGEERPAAALISFARKLGGRPQAPGRRHSAAAKKQSKRRGRLATDGMPLGADCRTAWEDRASDAARSGKSSPDASIIISRPGTTPKWTPQPGSHTYSRMAQAYKEARARVENVPSVRAYENIIREGETRDETPELRRSRPEVYTPPILPKTSVGSVRDSVQFNDHEEARRHSYTPPSTDFEEVCEIPWSEDELRAVFNKFGDSDVREVRTEELYSLLRYLGARPDHDELEELIEEQTRYASLDWWEFLEFIRRFRDHDLAQLRIQFAHADFDTNGTLDYDEISFLLLQSGFTPTPEVIQEAMKIVDIDGSGAVSFSEFEALREHLRATRGFMKSEAEEMKRLFLRVSRGQEKLMTDEIWRISSYIGYQMSQQEIRSIVREVDKDGSNYIIFDELLEIIRAIREGERDKLLKVIAQFALESFQKGPDVKAQERTQSAPLYGISERSPAASAKRNKSDMKRESRKEMRISMPTNLEITDIGAALALLGYFVSPEIVSEILNNQLSGHADPDWLSADELMVFLEAYRHQEGFTQEELRHLQVIFKKEQRSSIAGCNDEALDALELGRVLRGFGISKTLQQVQRLIEDIDFDGSGEVEFHEFAKMMRQFHNEEARKRRETFESLDPMGMGKIRADQIEVALKMIMDVEPDKSMMETAMAQFLGNELETLDITDFERFFFQYRRCLVTSVQEHAGFVPSEVEILREIFNLYDGNANGSLEAIELRSLIDRHMPEAGQSVQGKQKILALIEEVSPGTDGTLDFSSFLWLIRKCHDMRDEGDIVQEAEVVRTYDYSIEEVEGLRQLFSSHIDWAGELQLEALADILKGLVEITEQYYAELECLLKEMNPTRRAVARFPQFLRLMRKLTEENLFGVNDAADRTLLRQQLRKTGRNRSIVGNVRRAGLGQAALQATVQSFQRSKKGSVAPNRSSVADNRSSIVVQPQRRELGGPRASSINARNRYQKIIKRAITLNEAASAMSEAGAASQEPSDLLRAVTE